MVPRTVLAAKEVKRILQEQTSQFGNILGPQGFGWSNKYSRWLLGGVDTLGSPALSTYFVRSFTEPSASIPPSEFVIKLEAYAQLPKRKDLGVGSVLYPTANSTSAPPLNSIDPLLLI